VHDQNARMINWASTLKLKVRFREPDGTVTATLLSW
jgi:hypothetical protein